MVGVDNLRFIFPALFSPSTSTISTELYASWSGHFRSLRFVSSDRACISSRRTKPDHTTPGLQAHRLIWSTGYRPAPVYCTINKKVIFVVIFPFVKPSSPLRYSQDCVYFCDEVEEGAECIVVVVWEKALYVITQNASYNPYWVFYPITSYSLVWPASVVSGVGTG